MTEITLDLPDWVLRVLALQHPGRNPDEAASAILRNYVQEKRVLKSTDLED